MYQQQHAQPNMPEKDMAYAVLSDLKRVVREYATAATEASCQQVRSMFTNLLNSTLKMQGDLYQAMQQQNMYSTSSPALRQELDKQYKQYQQDLQQTNQFLQQATTAGQQNQANLPNQAFYNGQTNAHAQPNQPYYM
ncbi:spore coat protein [Paenibacillus protaetiae]|uniref:Spore coat protein n=1 Tax=Paenibacillus protaetiae TaxID=2509456 RepID=A0A4P6EVF6_9BACL|nr:spore coat protein [Paenibacillus protaetiae]QAY66626.1 spore coat protein [Paenibacillus protaetiae]